MVTKQWEKGQDRDRIDTEGIVNFGGVFKLFNDNFHENHTDWKLTASLKKRK
jgi:hypothetical protein